MRGLLVLLKKEFLAYFRSPLAYIFAVAFLLVVNGLYMNTFFLARVCDLRNFFQTLPVLLLIFGAALTMRVWAEERKSGTLGLLLGFPYPTWSLVLGKFLGTYLFALTVLAGTLVLPLMLAVLGDPDQGAILSGYLGAALLLSFYLSLGIFLSALFEDQIAAFVLTGVIGLISILVGTDLVSSTLDSWLPGVGGFLREALGILPHYRSFFRGVVPLRDVLFFLSYTLVFLVLNGLTVGSFLRYRRRRLFYPAVAIWLGLALFANAILSRLILPRLDLTEEKLYTLSPVTRKVLARLKAPLRITYYVSSPGKLPPVMRNLAVEVRSFLEELSALNPRVHFAVVDPERDPELARELQDRGIEPFAVQTIERDKVSVRRVYSALALSYLDKPEEVIPQVVPDSLSTLEYDLVSRIYRLTLSRKPVVALFTGASSFSVSYQTVRKILRDLNLQVKGTPLTRNNGLPKETRLLILLSPGKLNDRQLFEIGKFLHQGGSVLVAASAARFSYQSGPEGRILATPLPEDLSVNRLLSTYGLRIEDRVLLDRQMVTMAMSQEREMGIFRAIVHIPVNFPMQVQILPPQMDPSSPLTRGLNALLYLWGSPLQLEISKIKKLGLRSEVLFRSSSQAWARKVNFGALTPEDLRPAGSTRSYPLAVLLQGNFPLPFNGVPPPWPGEKKSPRKKKTKKTLPSSGGLSGKGRLLVIGSGAMFADGIIDIFDNALFLANAVESMALGGELLSLRAKLKPIRYLPPVSETAALFWRLVTVLGPAFFWMILGGFVFWRRRYRRQRFYREVRGESA
ncbi:MAG TPA: hypothetical protein ENJ40_04965 [Thermosulfurimonas dismutans]|uniref:Uncharacterized protein n=1 Tax=Thermosulfurimonas dismutans TaxID=999894 RepID=A0A7C3CK74_9BACT|nr:hypothetical protein [Thermosulfurimonas dismutans]